MTIRPHGAMVAIPRSNPLLVKSETLREENTMNATHLHLILNHVPVLGAFATLGLAVYALFKPNDVIIKLALRLMLLVGILTIPVFFTGEPAEEMIEHFSGVSESAIETHESFALAAFATTGLLAVIGAIGLYYLKKSGSNIMRYWKLLCALALLNAGLMTVTAKYGGEIRHTEIRNDESQGRAIENRESSKDEDD
jgi:uncharacterized membrane protein